jgi:hypothetical protein
VPCVDCSRQRYPSKTILIVYGDEEEQHELALPKNFKPSSVPEGVTVQDSGTVTIVNWLTTPNINKIIDFGSLRLHIVGECSCIGRDAELTVSDRKAAWNHWVLPIPSGNSVSTPYTRTEKTSAIVRGGYLLRTAIVQRQSLYITGDLNGTTTLEVLGGAPKNLSTLYFNGKQVPFIKDSSGIIKGRLELPPIGMTLPTLSKLPWKVIDSLPEIQANYSDALWTPANLNKTYNTAWPLRTPTSLFASDYGYHLGHIVFRGQFTATGVEKNVILETRGGLAFGHSVWLDEKFIGSWTGSGTEENKTLAFQLGQTTAKKTYTLTIVLDNNGHDEDWTVGTDQSKRPIGILDYSLGGREKDVISWKISGNLGGEDYFDRARGPANEGGLWAERQGLHLPSPPTSDWHSSSGPTEGMEEAGVSLFTTSFDLNIPQGLDVPLSLVVGKEIDGRPLLDASKRSAYRIQFYVNGWQYGKYINNIGPQTSFPVPEGIWNYRGRNQVSVLLWNLESGPIQVEDFQLVAGTVHSTGLGEVQVVGSPGWTKRNGAY